MMTEQGTPTTAPQGGGFGGQGGFGGGFNPMMGGYGNQGGYGGGFNPMMGGFGGGFNPMMGGFGGMGGYGGGFNPMMGGFGGFGGMGGFGGFSPMMGGIGGLGGYGMFGGGFNPRMGGGFGFGRQQQMGGYGDGQIRQRLGPQNPAYDPRSQVGTILPQRLPDDMQFLPQPQPQNPFPPETQKAYAEDRAKRGPTEEMRMTDYPEYWERMAKKEQPNWTKSSSPSLMGGGYGGGRMNRDTVLPDARMSRPSYDYDQPPRAHHTGAYGPNFGRPDPPSRPPAPPGYHYELDGLTADSTVFPANTGPVPATAMQQVTGSPNSGMMGSLSSGLGGFGSQFPQYQYSSERYSGNDRMYSK